VARERSVYHEYASLVARRKLCNDIIFILEVQSAVPRVLLEILRKIRQTMSDKDAGSAKTNKLVNLSG
jgi:uncharacterized protein YueI